MKQFFILVDLKKAYDTVPREALCKVLGKLSVPDILVNVVRSSPQQHKCSDHINWRIIGGNWGEQRAKIGMHYFPKSV